jgi:hypothetical protein
VDGKELVSTYEASHGIFIDREKPDRIVQSILYLKNLWYNEPSKFQKYCFNARYNALKYDWSPIVDRLQQMMLSVAKKIAQVFSSEHRLCSLNDKPIAEDILLPLCS